MLLSHFQRMNTFLLKKKRMNTLELEEGEIGHLENDEACNVQGLYYDV
jgi:hypothetical protein